MKKWLPVHCTRATALVMNTCFSRHAHPKSCSPSSSQGMLRSVVVGQFYKDLVNPLYETAFAIYHRRFSTNTTPKWPLAQPMRFLGHNGERLAAAWKGLWGLGWCIMCGLGWCILCGLGWFVRMKRLPASSGPNCLTLHGVVLAWISFLQATTHHVSCNTWATSIVLFVVIPVRRCPLDHVASPF